MEEWRFIEGTNNMHSVSSFGNIRRNKCNSANGRSLKELFIKKSIDSDGYENICISINGIKKVRKVHRIVALVFIDNPLNLDFVNHKDFDRANNNVSNLEWCSHSYNMRNTDKKNRRKKITIPPSDMNTLNGEVFVKHDETSLLFSNFGRIYNTDKNRFVIGSIKGGYQVVCKNKKGYRVHRVIADLFIENPSGLPIVNHRDGVKTNNNAENLEWATYSQNTQHAYDAGLKRKRLSQELLDEAVEMSNSGIKLADISRKINIDKSVIIYAFKKKGIHVFAKDVRKERAIAIYRMYSEGRSIKEISIEFGVSTTTIRDILNGDREIDSMIPKREKRKFLTDDEKTRIMELYNSGYLRYRISKDMGIHLNTICGAIKSMLNGKA